MSESLQSTLPFEGNNRLESISKLYKTRRGDIFKAEGSNNRNRISFATSGLCILQFTAFLGLTFGLDDAKSWSFSPIGGRNKSLV